ncbi:MAG: amidohydrolase family protein [Dermatophilaceae bacterium]
MGLSGALDRDALDRAADGRPVWIKHTSGHAYTLNGIGLTRLGIGESAGPQIDGGRVVTNGEDRPTGLLEENAMRLVQDVLQPDSEVAVRDALARATRHYATEGITSVTDAGIAGGWIGHTPREFACYQSARDAGLLRTRLQAMITVDALHVLEGHAEDPPAVGLDAGIRSGVGDEWLQIGPTKIFTDGSLLGATAAMTQEYCRSHGNVGYFQGDTAAMRSLALLAAAAGWSLALHAIGDRAVDFALDTIEHARVTCGPPRLPHRIEHGGVVRPDQVTRMVATRRGPGAATAVHRRIRRRDGG